MRSKAIWLALIAPLIMGAIVIRPLIRDTLPYFWTFDNLGGTVHEKREWDCSLNTGHLKFANDRVEADEADGLWGNCNYEYQTDTVQQLVQYCTGCSTGTCNDNAANRAFVKLRGESIAWTTGYALGTDPVAETVVWENITGESTSTAVASLGATVGDPSCETYAIEDTGASTLIHYWQTGFVLPSLGPTNPVPEATIRAVLGDPDLTFSGFSPAPARDTGRYVGISALSPATTKTWINELRIYDWTGTFSPGLSPPFFDDFDTKTGNWDADPLWTCWRSGADTGCGAAAIYTNDEVSTELGNTTFHYAQGTYQAETLSVQQWATVCDANPDGGASNFAALHMRCEDPAKGDCYGIGFDLLGDTVYVATYTPATGFDETIATQALAGMDENDCFAAAIEGTGSGSTKFHVWHDAAGTPFPDPTGSPLVNTWGPPDVTIENPTITDVHDTGKYCGASFNLNQADATTRHGIDDWGCGDWTGTIDPAPPADVCGDGQITGSEICDPIPSPLPHQGCGGGTPICDQPLCQSCSAESGPPPGSVSCTSATSGALTVDCLATIASGPAPLAVVFDAGSESSHAGVNTWKDIEYVWSFGDPRAQTWPASGVNRNTHVGPIAAHTFEIPGSYVVNVTGTNTVSGATATAQITITVDNPDAWYAGRTRCYSSGAAPGGCPGGGTETAFASWSQVCASVQSGGRTLVARGSLFSNVTRCELPVNTDFHEIGAYGSGAKPRYESFSVTDLFRINAGANAIQNFRMLDLDVRNLNGAYAPGLRILSMETTASNILVKRVDLYDNAGNTINFPGNVLSGKSNTPHRGIVIEDMTTIGDGDGYQIYYCVEYSVFQGLNIGGAASHNIRGKCSNRHGILHSYLNRSSFGNTGRNQIKMHCDDFGNGDSLPDRCEYIQISDNTFDLSSTTDHQVAMVQVGPQKAGTLDDPSDERMYDVVIERNAFWGGVDGPRQFVQLHACDSGVIRENIANGRRESGTWIPFEVNYRGAENPECAGIPQTNIDAFYNTCSSPTNTTPAQNCVLFGGTVDGNSARAKGNAGYFNTGSAATFVHLGSGTPDEANNWFGTSNPFESGFPNNTITDYRPAGGSPLLSYNPSVEGGPPPATRYDILNDIRSWVYDAGAIER